MHFISVNKKKKRHIVSNFLIGLFLLGGVIFIGLCPPIGMIFIALVLFS